MLADRFTLVPSSAGLHVTLLAAPGVDVPGVVARLREAGVAVERLADFYAGLFPAPAASSGIDGTAGRARRRLRRGDRRGPAVALELLDRVSRRRDDMYRAGRPATVTDARAPRRRPHRAGYGPQRRPPLSAAESNIIHLHWYFPRRLTVGRVIRTVALIGIDGAGKSTQARWLADWLDATGMPARYHRNAAGRVFFGRMAQRLAGATPRICSGWAVPAGGDAAAGARHHPGAAPVAADRHGGGHGQVYLLPVHQHHRARWTARPARLLFRLLPQPELVFVPGGAAAGGAGQGRGARQGPRGSGLPDGVGPGVPGVAGGGPVQVVDAGVDPSAVQASLRAALPRDLLPGATQHPPARVAQHLLPIG